VTPRRRDRLELEAPGIVRARPGFCEAGKRPSRAALLHAHIYQRNPDVGAVINAQPAHASAFCMTKAALSSNTIPESYLVLRDVPKLPFACIVEDAAGLAAQVSLKKMPRGPDRERRRSGRGQGRARCLRPAGSARSDGRSDAAQPPARPLVPMPKAALDELKRASGWNKGGGLALPQGALSQVFRSSSRSWLRRKRKPKLDRFSAIDGKNPLSPLG